VLVVGGASHFCSQQVSVGMLAKWPPEAKRRLEMAPDVGAVIATPGRAIAVEMAANGADVVAIDIAG
jgi:hypothetical protein